MKRSKETIKVIIITTLVTSIGFATTLETTIKADVKDDSTCIELNTNNENSIINTLRLKWKEDLTVGSKMDVKNSAIAKKISWYEKQTDNCLKSMNENPDNDWLWENLKEYKDKPSQITSMFNNILSMATSYNLPNNKYYKNKELKNKIIFALEWINKNAYNENIEQYGNWWDWVIGIPARLNNTTILMYDDLSQDQIKRYMDAIQKFLPIIDPGSKYHTGANLADVCINKLLQGVISKDPSKIKEASEDIEGVFEYVTNGDGFYADGSYVQHGIVAYTGSYGNVLIDKISNIMFLLEGTPWSVKSQSKNNVYKWIFESFDPIIYKGYVMDMVRGRSISRYNGNGYMQASGIIEGMIKLSMISDEDTSKKVQALVKEWANEAEEIIDFGTRFKSINVINKFYQFMKDDSIVATKQEAKHNALNMMDKTIHEREDYALSISRSSSRISKYEFMNKENLKPWFQGDGMTYLHNDDLTQFSDDFWPTIDPYRMPGTTIDKRLRKDKEILPGIDPGSSDQDEVYYELGNSNWSGGSKLGIYGISGMKIDNKYDSLTANKSWFMFDDEIVALGSDITNPEEYDNETIIENRKIKKDGSNRFIVDGEEKIKTLGDSDKVENAKWAYLEGNVSNSNIGYYFPDGADINILRDNREGNWFNINSSKAEADKVVTNNYLTMYINHGSKIKNEKYSYVLLPNKSVEEVKSYSEKSNIEILRNDEIAQGVKHLGLKMEGANFFVDGENTSGSITSTGNSSIMVKENNDKTLTIAVSDPTFQENNISVQINRKGAEVVSSDNEIANINLNNNKISFDVNTTDAKGKTFELVVKLVEDGSEEKQQIKNEVPVINGEDVNLTVGEKWNKNLHKIVATDKEDGDLTEKVRIKENNIKLNNDSIVTESGEYNVVFEVEDKDGVKTEKTFKVNVKYRNQAPVINGEDVNLTVGEKWNKDLHKIVVIDKEDGDLTEKVRIKENNIKLNNDSIVTESGEYNVVFEVEDKDGDKTEKTFKVNVKDRNQAPVINGEDVNLTVGEKWNKNLHKIVATDKEDGDLTEKVRIKENNIKLNNDSIVTESGEYNVVFEVEDKDGVKTEKTFKVNVKDRNQAPVINGEDVNLTVGDKWNKNLHKIVVIDKEDGDLTEKVRIKENNIKLNNDSIVTESGEYNVVFEVEDKDGDKTEKTFKVNVENKSSNSNKNNIGNLPKTGTGVGATGLLAVAVSLLGVGATLFKKKK
ncbi:polysaccharide lyase 8 family protein [Clostridium septicum]|uniref:polysaccharide lyase 8 family protein n=1 Tax=Clostridium septicum TaxID=1504 RepID=UPI00082F69EB|nr:polysaccharide lyase 8 family protein [Clostridium septicum]